MRQASLLTLADPQWIDVLRMEANRPKRTKKEIADELGISRTAVSLIIDGKYTAKLDKVSAKVAHKVMALYADRVWCPHLRDGISSDACRAYASAPMSISDPNKLRHYRACRRCNLNPVKPDNEVKNAV